MSSVISSSSLPLPDPTKSYGDQKPLILLAQVIWGEARGENAAAQLGVACVVKNRIDAHQWFGHDWISVILEHGFFKDGRGVYQFSSFDTDDPNSIKMMKPLRYDSTLVWSECLTAAESVYGGTPADPTAGAVFYFSPPIVLAPQSWGPTVKTADLGNLHFYKEG